MPLTLRAALFVGLLPLASLVACQPPAPQVNVRAASGYPEGISVVGMGEASAAPDIAYANVGVEVRAASLNQAVTEANSRMNRVVEAMKALGIAQKDLQTHGFNVHFEREMQPVPPPPPPPPPPTPRRGAGAGAAVPEVGAAIAAAPEQGVAGTYNVTNMLRVTVRDFQNLGRVFDEALAAGANNVWGLQFDIENKQALMEKARDQAVQRAHARALQLSRLAGVRLGAPLSIQDNTGDSPMPGPMPMMMRAEAMGGGVAIESGEQKIVVQVQVVYGIAD
jgi:hypothetical protein